MLGRPVGSQILKWKSMLCYFYQIQINAWWYSNSCCDMDFDPSEDTWNNLGLNIGQRGGWVRWWLAIGELEAATQGSAVRPVACYTKTTDMLGAHGGWDNCTICNAHCVHIVRETETNVLFLIHHRQKFLWRSLTQYFQLRYLSFLSLAWHPN